MLVTFCSVSNLSSILECTFLGYFKSQLCNKKVSPSILPTPSLPHKKVYITTCNNTHILFLLYKLNTLSCFYFNWSFVTRKRNRTLMKYENLLENMTKKVWKVMYVHPLQSNIKKNNINYTEHMHYQRPWLIDDISRN